GGVLRVLGADLAEPDTPYPRSPRVDRPRSLVRDHRVALAVRVVEEVDGEREQHLPHDDVRRPDVLDDTAAPTARLDPDATFGLREDAIRDDDVAHVAAHLAAEHDAAVAVGHRAVGDGDVLAGPAFI